MWNHERRTQTAKKNSNEIYIARICFLLASQINTHTCMHAHVYVCVQRDRQGEEAKRLRQPECVRDLINEVAELSRRHRASRKHQYKWYQWSAHMFHLVGKIINAFCACERVMWYDFFVVVFFYLCLFSLSVCTAILTLFLFFFFLVDQFDFLTYAHELNSFGICSHMHDFINACSRFFCKMYPIWI